MEGIIMWNEIKNESDAKMFVDKVYGFHDSCIKEMNYISGAYVEKNLDMHPLNTMRCLKLIIQRAPQRGCSFYMFSYTSKSRQTRVLV